MDMLKKRLNGVVVIDLYKCANKKIRERPWLSDKVITEPPALTGSLF